MKFPILKMLAAAVSGMAIAHSAHAVLQRVGPVDGAHGFPAWYQDANGLALEFCAPTTQADLIGGLCAILPGTPPNGLSTLPETFPGNFSLEHFYYLLSADVPAAALDKKTGLPAAGAGRFVFVNGVEAGFSTPVPEAGQQMTFNRWRVRMNAIACTGNYTFHTPSRAPKTVAGIAGGRIADTEDIGIGPTFDGAMAGSVGPYVLRALTPAGTASPFVAGADGKQYLSAGDIGAVTGSVQPNPFKGSTLAYIPPEIRAMATTNYVMVVGPGVLSGNCATTEAVHVLNEIQVLGRINTVPVASRSYVDRATYRALDSNADGVVDRFQVGAWANSVQEVGRPEPILALSLNKGDPADAANATPELAMIKLGAANYNSNTKVLTVTADSGALLAAASPGGQSAATPGCSDPCLVLDAFGLPAADASGAAIDYKMTIATGAKSALASVTIPNVSTPPGFVTVRSSAGGRDRQQVMYLGSAAGTAVFQPDVASTQMNLPVTVDVLANDVGVAATPNLLVCTATTGGTCGLPSATATCTVGTASASCTAQGGRLALVGGRVVYTPRANVGGLSDSFYYQAATVLGTTQRAQARINVGLLNGLPDARDDLGNTGIVGKPLSIDVLANDFAPAGVNEATLRITAQPFNLNSGAPAPGSVLFGGGKLVFTPPSAGKWSLAYTFTDKAGLTADQGVVTVNAIAAELVTVARARWTLPRAPNLGTLAVNGTVNVAQGQVLQLRQPNAATGAAGCNAPQLGTPLGEAFVLAGGAFDFGAIALATRPTAVYVYSPAFGGCTQATVQ
ncbi:MAG: hypothetical protein NT115_11085 [Proteobacteria bacterium]|nr:hypothetical protein [Pseudomonadota bacterium]